MTIQSMKRGLRVIPMLVIPLTMATAAAAQQHVRGTNAEANQVHARAEAVFQVGDDFEANLEQAAQIHARAAALRTVADPRFFDCVSWQAELLAATEQETAARRMYERAGDGALATGDVYNAGVAYVRAASIAQNQNMLAETTRLRDKVVLLTRSPLLSEKERESLKEWVPAN